MVLEGLSELKTKLPATNTSAPQESNFGALSKFTPPSISIKKLLLVLHLNFFNSSTFL